MFEMICRVFKIAGNSRRKIVAGIVCNILKSFFNGFMMFGVFWILLHLDGLSPAIIGQAFGVILGSVLGRFFFQWMYDRTMSGSGYDIFRDYRLEIGERLKQAPMGYFSEQNLGTIQAMLTTTIADLEGYSMLAIEQMTSDRYIHYADLHSHNRMPAVFSKTDDHDERATRVYMVVGRLDRYFPEITVRISNGGRFLEIAPEQVLEMPPVGHFPPEWLTQICTDAEGAFGVAA